MTESCCHSHEIMDVAAAVVTPGVDVDRLKQKNKALRDALQRYIELDDYKDEITKQARKALAKS